MQQATTQITAKTKPASARPAALILEDLYVAGMLKNHRLAQAIADVGWGEFKRQLIYKASWYGNQLYQAHRFFPSTQLCSGCHRRPVVTLDLGIRTYPCGHCGLRLDRDLNAARNLVWLYPKRTTASSAESDACGVTVRPEVLALRAVTLKRNQTGTRYALFPCGMKRSILENGYAVLLNAIEWNGIAAPLLLRRRKLDKDVLCNMLNLLMELLHLKHARERL